MYQFLVARFSRLFYRPEHRMVYWTDPATREVTKRSALVIHGAQE